MKKQLYNKFDKHVVPTLPRVTFEGRIHVVLSRAQAEKAVNYLLAQPILGLDTETRPSFRKGVVHKTALMQISTLDECFLFRTCKIGVPTALGNYLADPSFTKVGLSLHDDFKIMAKLTNVEPAGFIDLQEVVGKYCITDISLQKIYAIIFGGKIAKGQQLTNWEAPELSPAQQNYGAVDAWACLKIYNHLKDGLFDPNLSPYIIKEENHEQQED